MLLLDALLQIGSFALPHLWTRELVEAGAHVVVFNELIPPALRPGLGGGVSFSGSFCAERVGPLALRDHRKCLAIDGETAFVGSCNVSRDASGARYGGSGRFFDLHFKVWGPAAIDLAALFVQSLETATAWKARSAASQILESCVHRIEVSRACRSASTRGASAAYFNGRETKRVLLLSLSLSLGYVLLCVAEASALAVSVRRRERRAAPGVGKRRPSQQ